MSVIIPHAGGREMLRGCLESLSTTEDVQFEAIIVLNGTDEQVDNQTLALLRNVQILHYPQRLGYAGACNRGVDLARGELVFLLNNDARVEARSLSILAGALEGNDIVAACQPKLLSLTEPGRFDYSSAAGGEIDRYGYPFAHGRIFDTIEYDVGQYDEMEPVFWGAGAALMLKRRLYLAAGGLDEDFFAHMEEIDLLWRLRLRGYQTLTVPAAVVRHQGAATITAGSFRKIFLNHRNNLTMMFRNYGTLTLMKNLPVRLGFEVVLALESIIRLNFVRFSAVICANSWFWATMPYLILTRRRIQRFRKVSETEILAAIYPGSIVWQYYGRKRRTWREIRATWKRKD